MVEDTPLHIACIKGNIEIVRLLLDDNRVDPNIQGHRLRNPLHAACYSGNVEIVKILISHKRIRDIGAQDVSGRNVIHLACQINQTEIIELLLKDSRVNPNITDNGHMNSLHIACLHGSLGAVKQLMKYPHIETTQDHNHMNVFHFASINGFSNIVKELLHYPINPSEKDNLGRTPLHYACLNGHTSCTTLLLNDTRVGPWIPDNQGVIPLYLACQNANCEIVSLLMDCIDKANTSEWEEFARTAIVRCLEQQHTPKIHTEIGYMICKGTGYSPLTLLGDQFPEQKTRIENKLRLRRSKSANYPDINSK